MNNYVKNLTPGQKKCSPKKRRRRKSLQGSGKGDPTDPKSSKGRDCGFSEK